MKRNLKYIFLCFSITLCLLFLILTYISLRYIQWNVDFEKTIDEENISTEYDENIDILLESFTLSEKDTEFLELKPKEVGDILYENISEYLDKGISLEKIYIDPNDNSWIIYAKVDIKGIDIWMYTGIYKDNIQTAQIYFKDIYIGPYVIDNIFNTRDKINKGYTDTLIIINENGFLGRYLENIELMEEKVVIKGSRY